MPPGIRIHFEIDGVSFRHDGSPTVLRMRRAVARALREHWPRERILEQIIAIGKFDGSADLVPGIEIINGRESYHWTLTLWPELTTPSNSKGSRSSKSVNSKRRRAA
jgi:hypothetical protein